MTTIYSKPGGFAKLRYDLNEQDAVFVSVDWTEWVTKEDKIASSEWISEDGVTVEGVSTDDFTVSALITAQSGASGTVKVQNQITTEAGRKRSIAIQVKIVDLV